MVIRFLRLGLKRFNDSMSVHYQTLGVVLKKENYKEADQYFDVYTGDFGKVRVFGRGIRKIKSKLKPGIEFFYISEFDFVEGLKCKTITDTIVKKKFKGIRNDLIKAKFAYAALNLLNELTHHEQKDKRIFYLIIETLNRIEKFDLEDRDKKIKFLKTAYFYFFWNLTSFLGYQINLHKCSACESILLPNRLAFDCENGGIVCHNCQEAGNKIDVQSESIKIIRLILKQDWEFISKLKIEEGHFADMARLANSYLALIKRATN